MNTINKNPAFTKLEKFKMSYRHLLRNFQYFEILGELYISSKDFREYWYQDGLVIHGLCLSDRYNLGDIVR